MKKWLFSFTISLLVSGLCYTQNLVPNPSFEDYNMTFCGIMGSTTTFDQTIVEWTPPTSGNPDIYFTNIDQSCYNFQPDSQYGGPIGLKGTQLPRTGEVMAGIFIYTIPGFDQREYLQVQLNTPMVSGKAYIISFYASLGDYMEKSIDKLGAHLSVSPISSGGNGILNYTPQILESNFVDDIFEWALISDTIVAQEDYNYLTIGNFFTDDSTGIMLNPMYSGEPGTYGAYYFIDDVSVEETIITNTNDYEEFGFEIFPNPIQNEINISLSEKEDNVLIKLYNTHGVEVFRNHFDNQMSIKIDCSKLPAGAYFLQLQSETATYTHKLLKL